MTLRDEPFPAVPARTVLVSIGGVWLTYFALATARGWVVGLDLSAPMLWRRLLVTLASMAVTAALWPVLRLLDRQALWQKIVAVLVLALPASILMAVINQQVFADVEGQVVSKIGEREGFSIRRDEAGNILVDPLDKEGDTNQDGPPPVVPQPRTWVPSVPQQEEESAATIDRAIAIESKWLQMTDLALGRYFLLIAWAALYLALANAAQARAAERREGEFRRAAKAAELQSLRYQVNPHFLFNTLNSLSALVMTGKAAQAEEMIQTLSGFYRRSLTADPSGDVALEQEVALQRMYLELEAVRFPDRLKARFSIPTDLLDAKVPGMILQPLVENSVKYGVAPFNRAVAVEITAREDYGRLVLEVFDDGPGDAAKAGAGGFGIGLANVRDRLEARYGAEASLVSGPRDGGGWRTVIRLPLKRHD